GPSPVTRRSLSCPQRSQRRHTGRVSNVRSPAWCRNSTALVSNGSRRQVVGDGPRWVRAMLAGREWTGYWTRETRSSAPPQLAVPAHVSPHEYPWNQLSSSTAPFPVIVDVIPHSH